MRRPTWNAVWQDEMSVGIPEIDEDHKHFFRLINELNRSITARLDPVDIRDSLQIIVDDAERHFNLEEKLFLEWGYPDADGHAKIHSSILHALKDLMAKFVPYGFDSGWLDAGLKIRDILMGHIMTEDMKYAEYYKKSHAS